LNPENVLIIRISQVLTQGFALSRWIANVLGGNEMKLKFLLFERLRRPHARRVSGSGEKGAWNGGITFRKLGNCQLVTSPLNLGPQGSNNLGYLGWPKIQFPVQDVYQTGITATLARALSNLFFNCFSYLFGPNSELQRFA
jgi:hypothetical protein